MPEEESLGQRLIREREERLNRHEERIRREERDRERTARENKRAEGLKTRGYPLRPHCRSQSEFG